FRLRARVMLQMIAAIGLGFGEHRIGAQPLAESHVQFLAVRQATVGAVMHQDRKPELARADNRNRQHEGERIGPQRNHRDRAKNERPCMRDQGNALPGGPRAYLDQLLLGHQVAGANAKCGHGCFSLLLDALSGAEFPVLTTLSRAAAGGASACGPSRRSISAASWSGERPIACPSSVTPMAIVQKRRALVSGSSRECQPRAAISAA